MPKVRGFPRSNWGGLGQWERLWVHIQVIISTRDSLSKRGDPRGKDSSVTRLRRRPFWAADKDTSRLVRVQGRLFDANFDAQSVFYFWVIRNSVVNFIVSSSVRVMALRILLQIGFMKLRVWSWEVLGDEKLWKVFKELDSLVVLFSAQSELLCFPRLSNFKESCSRSADTWAVY